MGRQLSQEQLVRLEKHNYSCSNVSLLDPYMQKLWCWLVDFCPLWLAPNLITITGLAINVATALILIYFSPDAQQEVPSWSCVLCLLGLFAYQTLDAIDGKQARRTGTSSPLGELFDHGCDAVSTVFVSLSVCCATGLGSHPHIMMLQCAMATILFYCAHWQTYVSGTLRFGRIDVTEAQMAVMIILGLAAVFGKQFWDTSLWFVEGATGNCVPCVVGMSLGALALVEDFRVILVQRGAGRNGSTVAGTSVLSPVVALLLSVVPAVAVALRSNQQLLEKQPALFLLTFGLAAAKVTNKLVVSHMTRSPMAYTDRCMAWWGILLLHQELGAPFSEAILLKILCVLVTADLVVFCRSVCLDICDHLGIHLFHITPHKANEDPRRGGPSH